MKKTILTLGGALSLVLGAAAGSALACDKHSKAEAKADCDCPHKAGATAAKTGTTSGTTSGTKTGTTAGATTEKVALEGTIVSFGCPMEAAKQACTGAALVVGDTKHMIKKAGKGGEVVSKAKDTNKVVKVTGTKAGDFLTVSAYEIKS
jgi:hypothetical protein